MEFSAEQLKEAARKAYAAGDYQAMEELAAAAQVAESSRQRLRMGAQGLTFGFSDEAIAGVTNPLSALGSLTGLGEGKEYEEALARERGKLDAYRRDYPVESIASEVAGAAIPFVVGSVLSGGQATPALGAAQAPLYARALQAMPGLMKAGAKAGATYGFGTGEDGFFSRAENALWGGLGGAVAAPVAGAATYPVTVGATKLIDAARRAMGNRGGKAVEAEIQRLAEATGLTPDEIAAKVASGEVMADNATLRMATRALMAGGGRAEKTIRDAYDIRPPVKRDEAMQEIQGYLSGTTDENVLRGVRQSADEAKAAEGASFDRVLKTPAVANDDVIGAMQDALERFPGAGKEMMDFARANTKTTPFFTVAEDGTVAFTRPPSIQEAEVMRRFLAGKQDAAFTGGGSNAAWGPVYKGAEQNLRGKLDESVPALGATRANWAKIASDREAFETGQKIFERSADEVQLLMDDLARQGEAGAAKLKMIRSGAMDALRTKVGRSGGGSLMGAIVDPARKESAILRAILPDEGVAPVMQKAGVAAQSQAARGDIIKGPSTALVQKADSKLGSAISAEEMAAATNMNPLALVSIGVKMAKQAAPGLTDAQRARIAQVLVSEDPQLVLRALRDDSAMADFQRAFTRLADRARAGITGAAVGGTASTIDRQNPRYITGGPQ